MTKQQQDITQLPKGRSCSSAAKVSLAVALLLLAGCGKQVDLYDYFGDEEPAAPTANQALITPGQNTAGGAQPANALASNSAFANSDQAFANAQANTDGIKRVSLKNAQGVAVTVDDLPVTNYDVSQRINLENALGANMQADFATRKRILGTLVNEKVAKSKARKAKFNIDDRDLDSRINTMVGRMKISREELRNRLGKKGVNEATLKQQIEGSLYIRWVMSQQQVKTNVEVDQARVDAKYNEIISDPRLKPITVIKIRQVDLPVEKTTEAIRQQLVYARAVEARQIMARYKGCSTLSAASRDIFNVKVGKTLEADMSKLPAQLRNALSKSGTRKLIGPIPGPTGVRLIANCGIRKITPPRPTRAQVEASVRNEQFEEVVEQAMAEARKESFIDYKDPAFRP